MLSREWRCSWSSVDRWCSNYIWMINNFIAQGVTHIRGFMVNGISSSGYKSVTNHEHYLNTQHEIIKEIARKMYIFFFKPIQQVKKNKDIFGYHNAILDHLPGGWRCVNTSEPDGREYGWNNPTDHVVMLHGTVGRKRKANSNPSLFQPPPTWEVGLFWLHKWHLTQQHMI